MSTTQTPDMGTCQFHLYATKYCDRPATVLVDVISGARSMRLCAEHAAVYIGAGATRHDQPKVSKMTVSAPTEYVEPNRADDILPTLDVTSPPALPPGMRGLWEPWDLGDRAWTTAEALVAAQLSPDEDQRKAFGHDVSTPVREGLTAVVNGLTRDRTRYAVGYAFGGGTFQTDMKAKAVTVDGSVLLDIAIARDLRLGILMGATLHESGHVRYDRLETDGLSAAFPVRVWNTETLRWDTDPVVSQCPTLANLIGDIRLERRLSGLLPAYKALFPLTCWWVAKQAPPGRIPGHWRTAEQAVAFAITATRYDGYTRWVNDPAVLAERTWWIEWAERHAETKSMIPAVQEAADHIRAVLATLPPEIEPPIIEREKPRGTQPCGCGCTQVQALNYLSPFKPGCTDTNCQCHTGQGRGKEPGRPTDEPPQPPREGPEPPPEGPQPPRTEPDPDPDDVHHRIDPTKPDFDPERPGGTNYGISEGDDIAGDDGDMAGQEVNALNSALPLHASDANPGDARNFPIGRADHEANVEAYKASSEVLVTQEGGHVARVAIVPAGRKGNEVGALVLDPDSQRALGAAFKRKHTVRERSTIGRHGKIMPSKIHRLQLGSTAVFSRKDDPAPDRLDVHILIDASGSMVRRIGAAARVAANLSEALLATRYARVHVWAHNDGVGPGRMTLWDIFDSRRGQKVTDIGKVKAGGSNLDGTAIAALATIIDAERNPDRERSFIFVCSDGAPCEDEGWVRSCVVDAERKGISVISVAIDGGLTATQEEMYGHDSIVVWKGDFDQMGVDMADVLGSK